ncbi:ATP phosphoribosyltransferase [Alloscardovia venturai]|uniref:ATP phosphoribosyltransferase n=1 Tax=Alloscardovia venturai TaxID=1769421 RepID=A0ABW2Y3Y3_9BIFI
MLKIAVPNKGMLSEPAWNLLKEAGYKLRSNPRQLVVDDEANGIQLFYLRPLDIAVYVGSGMIDIGITGRDMLLNSQTEAVEQMSLGFGESTFCFAAPRDSDIVQIEQLEGKRIATSFDKIVADFLAEHHLNAKVVHLDGAVESSVQLGVADAIADVVSTGTTLRNAGLRIFGEPIVTSEAIVIRAPHVDEDDRDLVVFQRRLRGVMTAHSYVLMDYDIPLEHVEEAVAITPGFESPTVSPLHDSQWAAVRAMIPKDKMNTLMDQLYEVGARAIIITAIQASRM